MKKLLIFPFGGNAKEILISILEINKIKPTWKVIGFLDDNKNLRGKKFYSIPILGGISLIEKFSESYVLAVPGNPKTFNKRKEVLSKFKIPLSRFVTIIDPTARLAPDAKIGKNTVAMANVVISTGVTIGNHVVILPNSVIAHDTKVNDYCIIGANVTVSGYCTLGENCYVGSGTNIREKLTIGKSSLLGLGSNVIDNIPSGVVVAGNPAKILHKI